MTRTIDKSRFAFDAKPPREVVEGKMDDYEPQNPMIFSDKAVMPDPHTAKTIPCRQPPGEGKKQNLKYETPRGKLEIKEN